MNKTLLFSFILLFSLSFATIPYWVEHDENENALGNIWTKLNLSSTEEIQLYVYYGGSIDKGDGDAVFEFFDDFINLNTSKWTQDTSQYGIENSTLLTGTTDGDYWIHQLNNYDTKLNKRFKFRTGEPNGAYIQLYSARYSDNNGKSGDTLSFGKGPGWTENIEFEYTLSDCGHSLEIDSGIDGDGWHTTELLYDDSNVELLVDGVNKGSTSICSGNNIYNIGIRTLYKNTKKSYVDWLFISKYDPTVTITITYGSEENGNWNIEGDTYTKRKLITITSNKDLIDYQVNLDYSKIGNKNIYISDEIYKVTLDSPSNNTIENYISLFNWTVENIDEYECYVYIDNISYYAGQNSTYLLAPDSANLVGNHSWYVVCNNSTASYTTQTYNYNILEKTIDLISPNNNSINYNISNFTWNANNFIQPFTCNITIDGTTYEVEENKTIFNATNESNYYGEHNWSVFCKDSYDENSSEIYYYSIDNLPPNITLLTLNYLNVSPEYFIVNCYVDEPNVKEIWINLTSNDSYGHAGSVNATGNYDSTTNSYYAQFFWTQEEGVLYNYSCYVEDIFNQSDYKNNSYSTMTSTPSTSSDPDYWANYTFSNVYISITSPKEQDTIPFKQYYLTFTIDQDFTTPREAICKFYISYDLDYTDKTEIFSKTYTLDNSHTEIREPINTELSFLDYVGNYQRDTPSQQKVFIVCGLDNGYAGYTSTEYYVHLPSTLTLILLLISFLFVIISFIAFIYSDYGIVFSLLSMVLLLISVFSAASDGVAGSWYLSEVIIIGYILSNVSFILGFFKLSLESYAEYKEGL